MAQHGGASGLARAHRPRAPIMSIPVPLTAPLAPLRPPINISSSTLSTSTTQQQQQAAAAVSLVQPRPENERTTNEYVETPFRSAEMCLPPAPPHPPRNHRLGGRLPIHPTHHHLPPPAQPPSHRTTITKQPTLVSRSDGLHHPVLPPVSSFVKDPLGGGGGGSVGGQLEQLGSNECQVQRRASIVCSECGRCRCDSCQRPRPLPQRWVCGDAGCLLSADTVIDYASCLCCVKGLFYHCSESSEGGLESCADEPCGCHGDKRMARWTCLTTLSCVLPCLLLYWPLRGAKRLVEHCYARHSRSGCRCSHRPHPHPLTITTTTPEKRLLSSNSDF
ncbi:unnamed protein product [Brassicogethes aeneus]|uniref:Sprouty n=1 Tax=Brassicogethes aeneus TaxID=1431903 RepID=A0A9P0FKD4_BRAAE|nr:unnamed protein product [Brassicogethes aeneus]